MSDPAPSSTDASYARRLANAESVWWKRVLDVQRPYRWHLRRLGLGFVLDVGCGLGRNLLHVGGNGVGIDPNPDAVATCRARRLTAFTPDEFAASADARPGRFDALLISHVLEHVSPADAGDLLARYLPFVRAHGRVVLITPQEAGYASDPTHVEFIDLPRLAGIARDGGLDVSSSYSFPLPRVAGRWFKYNEFVVVARKP